MAFTYASGNGPIGNATDVDTTGAIQGQALVYDGTEWKPAGPLGGSLLAPQRTATGGRQYYLPRVNVEYEAFAPMRDAFALPMCFDKATKIWAFHLPYYFNPNRNGTNFYGQSVSNPGWQVRAYVYSTNLATGLPSSILFTSATATILPADAPGGVESEGLYIEVSPDYTVPANTPVWVVIAMQPVFDAAFPTGWNPNTKYKYVDGAWTADETGAIIGGPFNHKVTNQLAPLADLPATPWVHDIYGFPFGKNSLWYPVTLWDYDGGGAQVATNISTWNGHTNWPSQTFQWIPGSGNFITATHSPVGQSILYYVEATDTAFPSL